MQLSDQVVLVTGGTGALGQVVTKRLLAEGCTVVVTYLDGDEYAELEEDIATRDALELAHLTGYKVDVTADEQVEDLVDKVVAEHGQIDVLLQLVGGWKGGKPLHETGEDTWDDMIDINLKSTFLVARHVLPGMRENRFGRIVTVGSETGHDLPANSGPYAVAKHGVEAVTTLIARENADHNITANCILPDVIDTPANREAMDTSNADNWISPGTVANTVIDLIQDPERTGDIVKLYDDQ